MLSNLSRQSDLDNVDINKTKITEDAALIVRTERDKTIRKRVGGNFKKFRLWHRVAIVVVKSVVNISVLIVDMNLETLPVLTCFSG